MLECFPALKKASNGAKYQKLTMESQPAQNKMRWFNNVLDGESYFPLNHSTIYGNNTLSF